MNLVEELDARRRAGEHLSEQDADRLVNMLLDFHKGVVCALPTSGTHPERVGRSTGSGPR